LNASRRTGMRVTPVNWHLAASEIAYILHDREAKALVGQTPIASVLEAAKDAPLLKLKLSIGGNADGFESYEGALAGMDASDIDDPQIGSQMLYTSGTTGRPKGVYRRNGVATPPQFAGMGTNAEYDP